MHRITAKTRLGVAIAVLAALLVAVAGLGASPSAQSQETSLRPAPKRVYVVVIDGLRVTDLNPVTTPNLTAIKAQSVWYEQARAAFVTETLPNHAAMMTGVIPARNGIVGNKFRPEDGANVTLGGVYMNNPQYFRADTLVTRLERTCGSAVSTATVLSKNYLYLAFRGETGSDPNRQLQADMHWEPNPQIPASDHAPDAITMNAFLPWARSEPTPQFGFVNLGDVDRSGHADQGGTELLRDPEHPERTPDPGDENVRRANFFQQSVIGDTDRLMGDFVAELKKEGWWDESIVVFLSDHGMNWARQERWLEIADTIRATPRLDGRGNYSPGRDFAIVNNGAAEMVYLVERDPDERRNIVKAIRNIRGIERVFVDPDDFSTQGAAAQQPRSAYGLDDRRAGDVIVFAAPGYSFEWKAKPETNPIPGVHGHPVTQHSVLMVTGGYPGLSDPASVSDVDVWPVPSEQAPLPPQGGAGPMSVAPTVAALTGLGNVAGGYDGKPLAEAFEPGTLGGTAPFCAGIEPPPPAAPEGDGTEPPGGTDPSNPTEPETGDQPGLGGPAVTGTASATLQSGARKVAYGRPFVLSGRTTSDGGCPRPDWVELRRKTAGERAYRALTELLVSPDGRWRMELTSRKSAQYIAAPEATKCATAASSPVSVLVRANVSIARVAACTRGGAVSGTVRPKRPGTRILLQRRQASRWKTIARAKLDGASGFRLRPRRCRQGLHRVVWPKQGAANLGAQRRFTR